MDREVLIFNCSEILSKTPESPYLNATFLSYEELFNWKDGFKRIHN